MILRTAQTIEAAVLSETGKMLLPVYDRVFSAAEEGHVSATYENPDGLPQDYWEWNMRLCRERRPSGCFQRIM